jgi:hypothetical protein
MRKDGERSTKGPSFPGLFGERRAGVAAGRRHENEPSFNLLIIDTRLMKRASTASEAGRPVRRSSRGLLARENIQKQKRPPKKNFHSRRPCFSKNKA